MAEERPDISEAGFEFCPPCDDWHLPAEHAPRY